MTAETSNEAFADPVLRSAVSKALGDAAPTPDQLDDGGVSPHHWKLAADMGWIAVSIDESHGGLGLGLPFVADLCEQAGRHLFCGPLAETAVLLPALSREIGAFADLLPGVVSGEVRVAYAEPELVAPHDRLMSPVFPVEHADRSTHLLFLAERDNRLQVIFADCGKAEFSPLQAMDLTAPVAEVTLGEASDYERFALDTAATERVLTALYTALAADLLGVGEAALSRTVEHVRGREQFGQPLGAFQAVKHRLANVHTTLKAARLAIAKAAGESGTVRDARIARILSADAALGATSAAIQLHGGSGFSWELDLHLFLKRARRLNARNGGTSRLRAAAGNHFIEQVLVAQS